MSAVYAGFWQAWEVRDVPVLRTEQEYRAATVEVKRLEKLKKEGKATAEDRLRLTAGLDHLLIYEWSKEGRENARGTVEVVEQGPEVPEPVDGGTGGDHAGTGLSALASLEKRGGWTRA
jgi:hypothetical protein